MTQEYIEIRGARANKLQNVLLRIPKRKITTFTGVSGSGKSSLINELFLSQHPDAIVIDQAPVGTSARSSWRPTSASWTQCAKRLPPPTT